MLNGVFAGLMSLLSAGPSQAPPAPPPAAVERPATDVEFRWRDHPQIRVPRVFRVDFVGKLQWDARDPGDDPSDFDTYELHRARV